MIDNAAVLNPPPAVDDAPILAWLDRFEECEEILARNNVGRIAFALQDRVSVVPVHYVYDNGWIYGRTAAGGKLRELLRNRRIAFEVDEHSQLFEWRSVVVRGPLYLIEPGTLPSDQRTYAKAVSLIRLLLPTALTESDPVPFRDQLFRIRAVEISGRSSEPSGGRRVFSAEKTVRDSGEADSDAILGRSVETALAKLSLTPGSQVRVDAFDGVIVLTGTVEDAAERSGIEAAVLGRTRRSGRGAAAGDRFSFATTAHAGRGRARGCKAAEPVVRRLGSIQGSRGVIDKLHVLEPPTAQVVAEDSQKETL